MKMRKRRHPPITARVEFGDVVVLLHYKGINHFSHCVKRRLPCKPIVNRLPEWFERMCA